MLIIGFGNKSRHGKDTAAEAIKNFYDTKNTLLLKHGQDKAVTRIGVFKFATALYQEVADYIRAYGGAEKLFSDIGKGDAAVQLPVGAGAYMGALRIPTWVTKGDPTPIVGLTVSAPYGKHPKLLQWWGTEYRRKNFGENYWVDKLFESIPSNIDIALVSDVRFQNEADSITERGGYNVNVTRLLPDGTPYRSQDRPADHLSETALDSYPWQFRLSNHEGHQALLEEQAITLTEYLRGLK
jgi:hypothetical protein